MEKNLTINFDVLSSFFRSTSLLRCFIGDSSLNVTQGHTCTLHIHVVYRHFHGETLERKDEFTERGQVSIICQGGL